MMRREISTLALRIHLAGTDTLMRGNRFIIVSSRDRAVLPP